MGKRASWLSVTPEPERELPEAVATLRAGAAPDASAVDDERRRIERLVLHGSERAWLAYLHTVVRLIEQNDGSADPAVSCAHARAAAVISNHHHLLLALPGRAADRTAADRDRLAADENSRGAR